MAETHFAGPILGASRALYGAPIDVVNAMTHGSKVFHFDNDGDVAASGLPWTVSDIGTPAGDAFTKIDDLNGNYARINAGSTNDTGLSVAVQDCLPVVAVTNMEWGAAVRLKIDDVSVGTAAFAVQNSAGVLLGTDATVAIGANGFFFRVNADGTITAGIAVGGGADVTTTLTETWTDGDIKDLVIRAEKFGSSSGNWDKGIVNFYINGRKVHGVAYTAATLVIGAGFQVEVIGLNNTTGDIDIEFGPLAYWHKRTNR